MSSSRRVADIQTDCVQRAWVVQGECIVGGMDLPVERDVFIEQFNREYAAAGLRVVPIPDDSEPVTST